MALLSCIIAGSAIFEAIGIPTPEFVKTMQESKWMYGLGVFLIGNNLQSSLLSSGAFEIYLDDQLVYSKI